MIKLDEKLKKERSNARLLLQVHDELILECPEENCEETKVIIKEVMEKAVDLSIPLKITIETGNSWGKFH